MSENVTFALVEKLGRIGKSVDKGGEPPDDGAMEARVAKLESDMSDLKTDMAVVRSNYGTKEDIANAKNAIIMWVVGAIFLAQLLPGILKKIGLG